MYQVIELYGDFEPWWFLEDWQEDIVERKDFEAYQDALACFDSKWQALRQKYPYYQSRKDLLAVFWDNQRQRWCEDCGESLQQYSSLMLLKDNKVLPLEKYIEDYEQENANTQSLSTCVTINIKKD